MKQEERKRILIVDDDKSILKSLGDFLGFRGFEVVVAESGEEGLSTLAIVPPDIILLDISMPGMGGIGFLRRIMSSNGTLPYPVLVFTARTTTEDYFRDIPVDGFIAKPCDRFELMSKLQGILEKHKRATPRMILIGEDDRQVADHIVRVFHDAGFEVEEAGTGPEVLEKAAVCLPDAILIKQILTGLNGDAVASILQAMPRTLSIPVVLYDESGMAQNPEEADRLRHTRGIKKYVTTQDAVDLLKALKEVLCLPGLQPGAE